jgi:hypothetical protein
VEADNRIIGIISVTDIARNLAKILFDDYNRYRSLKKIIDIDDIAN